MRNKFLALAAAGLLAVLLTTSDVRAWGAYHAGYTHFGPAGVTHYGRTAAYGPYGGYAGGHVSHYGYAGGPYSVQRGNVNYVGYHPYTPTYTGYHYGGFGYGPYGAAGYRAGVYRAW